MMKIATLLATVGAAASLAASANAQSLGANGTTADEFAAWMNAQGYPGSVQPNRDAPSPGYSDKLITATLGSVKYIVYFYGCEQSRCSSIQLAGLWTSCHLTIDQMNLWGQKKRYAKSVLYPERSECWVEMDLDLIDASDRYATMQMVHWRGLLSAYANFVGSGTVAAATPGAPSDKAQALASLVVGQSTLTDVLNIAGAPTSEERLDRGGTSVSYSLSPPASAPGAVASSTVVLNFDRAGLLRSFGSAAGVPESPDIAASAPHAATGFENSAAPKP
jgi:hypothetical protein